MTKTLNQIIFFFLHQNQNIFFSNIGNQNIFLEKNHNPPFKLNGRSLSRVFFQHIKSIKLFIWLQDYIPTPNIFLRQQGSLGHIVITENEDADILKFLDISKASGPDAVSPRLLKEATQILKSPLCRLFNLFLRTGIFPTNWKCANVTPIFKKDSPSNYKNYRPISLISVIGKVMERCVFKHIHNYLLENNIIINNQSGFTKGDSAIYQLINITNDFGKALDEGKEVRVIFCDISKAFDRVWHRGLLKKLELIGIRGSLLDWVQNYLSGRKQRVVINNASSDWGFIKAGVPQGSILEPLYFFNYFYK
jgi:hypothetical protein